MHPTIYLPFFNQDISAFCSLLSPPLNILARNLSISVCVRMYRWELFLLRGSSVRVAFEVHDSNWSEVVCVRLTISISISWTKVDLKPGKKQYAKKWTDFGQLSIVLIASKCAHYVNIVHESVTVLPLMHLVIFILQFPSRSIFNGRHRHRSSTTSNGPSSLSTCPVVERRSFCICLGQLNGGFVSVCSAHIYSPMISGSLSSLSSLRCIHTAVSIVPVANIFPSIDVSTYNQTDRCFDVLVSLLKCIFFRCFSSLQIFLFLMFHSYNNT